MDRLAETRELLDGPLEPRTLAGNLRDLSRINRWLGGASLSWRALVRVRQIEPVVDRLTLLDVGTGAADIPRALLRRAGARRLELEVTATDVRPQIVDLARDLSSGMPNLTIALADGDRLAHPDAAFDVVHSSLLMHHLEPDQVVALLVEMRRVARRGVIVNDLDRARRWWFVAWLLTRLATANRYTRHDAPMSVRRAYRPQELVALAHRAGLHEVARLHTRPAHRYALVLVAG